MIFKELNSELGLLVALFKNVYKKSSASYRTWMFIADRCYFDGAKAPVGMDFPPSEYEVRQILSENKYVDYIGPVMFKIDFASNVIDTKNYDKEHETNTNSKVKTAKDCIDQLRCDFELAQKKAAEEAAERKAQEEKREKLMRNANELIRKVLANDNCKLSDSYLRTLDFSSKQSFEALQEHAKTLTLAGLSVKVSKESSLLDVLITIPAKLELLDKAELIVEKLSAHLSQAEQLRNTATNTK